MRAKGILLTCAFAATLLGVAGSAAFAGGGHGNGDHHHQGNGDHHHHFLSERARIGLKIAPVPLNTRRRNLEQVGLGSYLVNAVGSCNECHTHPSFQPGGNPFLGEGEVINTAQYLSGGRQFGPFTSSNLTPDEDGRPGGMTYWDFRSAIRTGRDPVDSHILQVMPWPPLANMSNDDLRAIYEYLRAIPSLPDNPAPGP